MSTRLALRIQEKLDGHQVTITCRLGKILPVVFESHRSDVLARLHRICCRYATAVHGHGHDECGNDVWKAQFVKF